MEFDFDARDITDQFLYGIPKVDRFILPQFTDGCAQIAEQQLAQRQRLLDFLTSGAFSDMGSHLQLQNLCGQMMPQQIVQVARDAQALALPRMLRQ